MTEKKENTFLDIRHKGKDKALKIFLINMKTEGEKSSSFTFLYKNRNLPVPNTTLFLVTSLFLTPTHTLSLIPL
jgi:hypothetical protein